MFKVTVLSAPSERSGTTRDGKEWSARTQDAKVVVGEYAYPLRLYLRAGEQYELGDHTIAPNGWDYTPEKGLYAKKPFQLVKAR